MDRFLGSILAIVVLIVLLCVYGAISQTQERDKRAVRCEQAGGVLLRYKPHKRPSSESCVRKDAIIDLK